jgi:hypothetical protein
LGSWVYDYLDFLRRFCYDPEEKRVVKLSKENPLRASAGDEILDVQDISADHVIGPDAHPAAGVGGTVVGGVEDQVVPGAIVVIHVTFKVVPGGHDLQVHPTSQKGK